jgi:hypothetical protein
MEKRESTDNEAVEKKSRFLYASRGGVGNGEIPQ